MVPRPTGVMGEEWTRMLMDGGMADDGWILHGRTDGLGRLRNRRTGWSSIGDTWIYSTGQVGGRPTYGSNAKGNDGPWDGQWIGRGLDGWADGQMQYYRMGR